jgi:hypothetical protein
MLVSEERFGNGLGTVLVPVRVVFHFLVTRMGGMVR